MINSGGAFMKNAKKFKFLFTILMAIACIVFSCTYLCLDTNIAFVKTDPIYCADIYDGDNSLQKSQAISSYDVYFDKMEETVYKSHFNAPSFGNTDSSMTNCCAPLAGINIVGFYDRWCENLIPNYEPGMLFGNGTYQYFPDMGKTAPRNVLKQLYSLMKTGELGGTTSTNFKNGLKAYVNSVGYNLSYSSFYNNKTSVDLQKLTSAIDNNKIGLLMCSEYNYVNDIVYNDSHAHITKRNNSTAHMMMVYGYVTYTFYKDNAIIRTDTFLNVCSSYSSGDVGYMQLYDYSKIDEALIISIT